MKKLLLFIVLLSLSACKKDNSDSDGIEVIDIKKSEISGQLEKESSFGEPVDVVYFKNTEFLATPDYALSDKNAIYCSTLLLAWNQIEKTINSTIKISDSFPQFKKLNSYKDFENSLKAGEYQAAAEVDVNSLTVRASASFAKQLPFTYPMNVYKEPFAFKGEKVQAFYTYGGHEYRVNILEYKSDSDFMVRLNPKDREHEIILWMPKTKPKSLQAAIEQAAQKKGITKAIKPSAKNAWRYNFGADDILVVPKMYFNLKSYYPELTNNTFSVDGFPDNSHSIAEVYQRTSFRLDEKGATVESEAQVTVATEAMPDEEIKPKNMLINKPFLLMLKRRDSPNPYLAVWVENAELMIKE